MVQQGQTFELTRCGADGRPLWAYRYRTGGRDSKRVQRGGFASEQDARDALDRELEQLRRERRIARRLTLSAGFRSAGGRGDELVPAELDEFARVRRADNPPRVPGDLEDDERDREADDRVRDVGAERDGGSAGDDAE